MKIQIFKIAEKTEDGLNTLIEVFLKNNNVTEVVYKEDYVALIYED